jgi:carboxypeptidase family protein
MTVRNKILLASCLIIPLAGGVGARAQGRVPPAGGVAHFGAISGRIHDSRGIAQPGVPVTVTRQDGLFIRKVYTGGNGRFELGRLSPGLYAVEVILPSFLPFSKAPLSVKPGSNVVVEISLLTLAESVEIGIPVNPAQAREDWKWALRTASPERSILHFQGETEENRKVSGSSPHDRPLRGTVLVSAGNESRSFGSDPGLRTIFDVAYDWSSRTSLDMSGSAGWERATPAASFRTAWTRRSENDSTSTLSAAVRQLFLPGAYRSEFSGTDFPFRHRIQSFSGRYENETPLGDRLSLRYGALFESVSMRSLVSQWSPYGQLTYSPDRRTRWTFAYSAEAPRLLPSGPSGASHIEELQTTPQMSSDINSNVAGSHLAALETGRHLEAAWQRRLGGRYRLEAATFFDSLSDVAISLSSADDSLTAGLLRDPFSDTHFLDGGKYSSPGGRATFGTRLFPGSEVIVSYSYGGGLRALSNELKAENSRNLRDLLRSQQGSTFVVKVRSTLPLSHTEVITSYKWLPRNAVVPSDPYNSGSGRSEPYLNLALVQPLPSPEILQGQFQAIADFSNLLAQGYLPIHGPDGGMSYFFPSARSFRGGFSFVF